MPSAVVSSRLTRSVARSPVEYSEVPPPEFGSPKKNQPNRLAIVVTDGTSAKFYIDGALVGGASLDPDSFAAICRAGLHS